MGRCRFGSPGTRPTNLSYARMVLFLICTLAHGGESRLRWSVGKIRTSGLGRHVLHLCRAANGLLAIMVPDRGLMLGARLG